MPKYLFAYTRGSLPETEEEQASVMAAWGAWLEEMGSAVVDPGNPFGPSKTVATDGSVSEGETTGLGGYSVIETDDLDSAVEMAKGSPNLTAGGTVEVYETIEVM